MKQTQFLDVVSREEASRRFKEAVAWTALASEPVALANALHRVLGEDIAAPVDVPGFTRSNMDGFAVRARDTFGASEEAPITLTLTGESLGAGVIPEKAVETGAATEIATGGVVPRGADAVVMIEDCDTEGPDTESTDTESTALTVRRAVAPGTNLAHAGSDIARGEVVLREGCVLTSRETGVLAALGLAEVRVVKKPRVTLFSTGDELLAPGDEPRDGFVFDSNSRILADAVREAGGQVFERGFLPDDEAHLSGALKDAVTDSDLVLLSGGTSKGAGDLSYRVIEEFGEILVHGVALKPGKPVVLARAGDIPVVILPGFPTSAVFTFHEFVAPWIRSRAGRMEAGAPTQQARLARAVTSVKGRTEFDLVHLIDSETGLVAYPLGKGSGSVTTFSRADGFYRIPAADERREAGELVEVTLLGDLHQPDLTVIGSHCTGLDLLLSELRARGFSSRVVAAGSVAGLEAAHRGECDVAPVHLFDEKSGEYNRPFLKDGVSLIPGYGRRQGVVSRDGDESGRMINRNRRSGTRTLIDGLLGERRPDGYELEVRSHQAVAAAVKSGRADWGVCIENVAEGLHFRFLAEERLDFAVPDSRAKRPAVSAFRLLLLEDSVRERLRAAGFVS